MTAALQVFIDQDIVNFVCLGGPPSPSLPLPQARSQAGDTQLPFPAELI